MIGGFKKKVMENFKQLAIAISAHNQALKNLDNRVQNLEAQLADIEFIEEEEDESTET